MLHSSLVRQEALALGGGKAILQHNLLLSVVLSQEADNLGQWSSAWKTLQRNGGQPCLA